MSPFEHNSKIKRKRNDEREETKVLINQVMEVKSETKDCGKNLKKLMKSKEKLFLRLDFIN